MFQFFDQIGNFLQTVVDLVLNFFTSIGNFFKILYVSLSFMIDVVGSLPVPVQAACLAIISASVIYLVVGR